MATDAGVRAGRRELTDEQRRALGVRGVSVALSAGAGCGKTFVLTERFLGALEPDAPGGPADLAQLVAITFTDRAAREMRDRIRRACAARLLAAPEDEADHWRRLVRQLDTARISTIHSFCTSLLRSMAVEAGLDPQFQVLDAAGAATLCSRVLAEHVRDRLAERDEGIVELSVVFGLSRVRAMLAALLNAREEIDFAQWRETTPEQLAARWEDYWRREILPLVARRVAASREAAEVLAIARAAPCSHPAMRERFAVLVEKLGSLAESRDVVADLAAVRAAAGVQGGGRAKAWETEELYECFKETAESLRKAIDREKDAIAFDPEAARPAAEAGLSLLRLTSGAAEAFERRKRELGVLDFNDLLIAAGGLLLGDRRAELRRRLSAQIRLLLVDEFQDTDPLQVELVKALCDEGLAGGKLFFVGDYKQSIYRFRGARPHVFRRLRLEMPSAGRLPLSLNFRSQPAVLRLVNALFGDEMGPDYEPLRASRPQVSPTPAVELLWAAPGEDDDPKENSDERRRREAEWIARRIRAMLASGESIVWDEASAAAGKPAARPPRPGDFALLFRALSNVELYEEALRRHEIPYYLVGGHAFYMQQEIYDVLNLLRAVDCPADELSLAGVLRSGMFGLHDETLFWLARRGGGLVEGLLGDGKSPRAAAGRLSLGDEQARRVEFARRTLRALRAMKDRVPVAELLLEAMDRTGYDAALLAEFLGQRKLANLRKLIDQARSFDRSGIFTLSDFIVQLGEFVAEQPKEALAATLPETTDVVRLMTIHQAKGLEFPIVVVPDLDAPRRGSTDAVAFTPELGPLVKHPDAPGGLHLHQQAEREEDEAELVRLLYVATTRAADYLLLAGCPKQVGKPGGPWTELLMRRFDPMSGRPLDGAGGADAPEIHVTLDEPPLVGKPAGDERRSLKRLLDRVGKVAAKGKGRLPGRLAPIPADPSARRQWSFSRLRGTLHGPTTAAPAAARLDVEEEAEPVLDPLGLGTLVHAVLAEVDFARGAEQDVAALVRRHATRHLPTAGDDQAAAAALDEPVALIRRFLGSPRAAELARAKQCHRELEFLLAWPPGVCEPGGRYVQGFIDCFYQDAEGGWHVVDYKTNRADRATLAAEAAAYEMQMLVYALAVERILGEPPAGLALCFLRPGLEYHFEWNDAARRRAVEMVNEAMARSPTTKPQAPGSKS